MEKLFSTEFLLALSAALVIAVLIAVLPENKQQREEQQTLYCEMVTLSIETNGELGWPDFRNRYTIDC
jgi:hypothetical protein